MIKTTNTLTCKFMDNQGKNMAINIDNPREDLTVEEIEAFMYYMIDSEVLMPNVDEPDTHLLMIAGASFETISVEIFEI